MSVPIIQLFLKAPIPGYVKTRLARTLGDVRACAVYKALVHRQIKALPAGWPLEIHFTPPKAEASIQSWIVGADRYVPQADGNLGARLAAAAASAFRRRSGQVFLIGADCPTLDEETFYSGLAALTHGNDVAFGPTRDGGYYLLALKLFEPALFQGIPWSTPEVLERSLQQAEFAGLIATLLEEKDDIDDWDSLRRSGFTVADSRNQPQAEWHG